MSFISEENFPQIVAAVLSINTVWILRDVLKNWRWWRTGATEKEKSAIRYAAEELARCHKELSRTQDERDYYRRQVGRRDHLLLSNGIELPQDGSHDYQ